MTERRLKTGDRVRAKVNADITKRGDTGTVLYQSGEGVVWLNDKADTTDEFWPLSDYCHWQLAKLTDQTPNPAHVSFLTAYFGTRDA